MQQRIKAQSEVLNLRNLELNSIILLPSFNIVSHPLQECRQQIEDIHPGILELGIRCRNEHTDIIIQQG